VVPLCAVYAATRSPGARRALAMLSHFAVAIGVAAAFAVPFGGLATVASGVSSVTRFANFLAPTSFLQSFASATSGSLHRLLSLVSTDGPLVLFGAVPILVVVRACRTEDRSVLSMAGEWAAVLLVWLLLQPQVWP